MMKRRGAIKTRLPKAMITLKESPEGSRVKIVDGIEGLKSTRAAIYPALDSREIDQRVLLKIAYEYLALNLSVGYLSGWFRAELLPCRTLRRVKSAGLRVSAVSWADCQEHKERQEEWVESESA